MKHFIQYAFLVVMIFSLSACAGFGKSLKSLVGGGSNEPVQAKGPTRFSEQSNVSPGPQRQYKKTTRQSFEDQSRVDARSGSLWVMEGQGAYLFSENVIRLVGDPINIELDGEPKTQLDTKVRVIRGLLAKLDAPKRQLASTATAKAPAAKAAAAGAKKDAAAAGKEGEDDKQAGNSPEDVEMPTDKNQAGGFDVKNIPTRIVERLVDGNYRVKGAQNFMIGKREYRVIVTGIVRSEEFTETGVAASKLLEPKFDIVSAAKGTQRL